MGYVPPPKPSQTYIATLYTLARIYDVGAQFLGPSTPRKTGYQRYLEDLYGHRPTDRFIVLNYAMLACLIALIFAIAWAAGALS